LAPLEQSLKPGLYRITDRLRSTSTTKKRTGFQNGITVLNSPGTVDADYRGEIGVILVNLSNETFVIQNGERIAQLIIAKHERADWIEVQELSETSRGEGGSEALGVNIILKKNSEKFEITNLD
jgi:dUTP pyrophosphatase